MRPLAYEQFQWHNSKARLFSVFLKPPYLFTLQKKFAVASSGMIVISPVKILGYVHIFHPYLAVIHITECVDEASFALTERFYFRSGEHYTCRECFDFGIVISGGRYRHFLCLFCGHLSVASAA